MSSAASAEVPPWSRSMTQRAASTSAPRARRSPSRDDLAAAGHHVLDDQHPAAADVGALGEAAGAVRLGLLADEGAGQTGVPGERGHDGDAAHLQAGQHLGVRRDERGHAAAMSSSSTGSASKWYLSKYSVRAAGPQGELAGQVGGGTEYQGQLGERRGPAGSLGPVA